MLEIVIAIFCIYPDSEIVKKHLNQEQIDRYDAYLMAGLDKNRVAEVCCRLVVVIQFLQILRSVLRYPVDANSRAMIALMTKIYAGELVELGMFLLFLNGY